MIALLVITDGRDDYLQRTVTAASEHLHGHIGERFMFDDTGDAAYRAALRRAYPTFTHLDGGPRQGFGGAIRAAWAHLASTSRAAHVFHLEQDFVLARDVDLDAMVGVLDAHPYLVQLALRRQAWSADETDAGGVVERYPAAYTEVDDGDGNTWLEHRLFFTTNPCLYRRSLVAGTTWPDTDHSEGTYTMQLLRDGTPEATGDEARFGYWGARDSGVAAWHIGEHRNGTGY